MHGAYLWSSGTSVLYIGCMVPIWEVRYVCPIYRMHGAYLGSTERLSYIQDAWCLKVNKQHSAWGQAASTSITGTIQLCSPTAHYMPTKISHSIPVQFPPISFSLPCVLSTVSILELKFCLLFLWVRNMVAHIKEGT